MGSGMIVLGIDPGTAMTGYGVVLREGAKLRALDYGCLETLSTQTLPIRLLEIHRAVTELIVTHKPDRIGVERLFFNKNVHSAFAVGQARGVLLLARPGPGTGVLEHGPNGLQRARARPRR